MELNRIYNADCIEALSSISTNSVDCVLTDPPFLYLKNQKLERPFDEEKFFSEIYRVLKNDGMIAFFGRGVSFYRWCTICDKLGFKFIEELIWDKGRTTSPVLPIGRMHETISVWGKGRCKIRRCYIPYFEAKDEDITKIISDIKRLKSVLSNPKELDAVQEYLKIKQKTFIKKPSITKYKTSCQDTGSCSRAVNVMAAICGGTLERTIIKELKNTYRAIHPTEKPVRLMERLINLISDEGDIILDPFCGSASTCVAAKQTGRHYLGFEIDEEYFKAAQERLQSILI